MGCFPAGVVENLVSVVFRDPHFPDIFHSFNKYLLNSHYVPGSVLEAGNTAVNKADKNPGLHRADILSGYIDLKYDKKENTYYVRWF